MDFHLWLMASACADYDDDAQISCEHGGEGGQNVVAVFNYNSWGTCNKDDWWWWWPLPLLLFIFFVVHSILLLSFPIFTWFIIFTQRQPEEGWWGNEQSHQPWLLGAEMQHSCCHGVIMIYKTLETYRLLSIMELYSLMMEAFFPYKKCSLL